ncbi:EamA family transporter [Psychroflexus sediminis]|uniref:EamA-like transporter family protein n=1 Tax=Psychroflexus sediminis TaxID=470826 RepID=A0A1G7VR68_9FLAO|nr:EamA family transporter [Psychroflexus sediminis]SDG62243.1 EamA-like transporter family protein [Psychroflexus sediminis]
MIALILSILSSSAIYIVFKLFGKYNITTLNALIVNYFIAFVLGFMLQGNFSVEGVWSVTSKDWFYGSMALGAMFILVFSLMVITTQKGGMSVVSVASKMSVAIPVVFVILYYNESLGVLKIIGIIMALMSVYLVSVRKKDGLSIDMKYFIFPLLVFLGSGIIESSIKFLENTYVPEDEVSLFSAITFFFAFVTGLIVFGLRRHLNKPGFKSKDVIGGFLLGIPNYFSIYFFILALRIPGLDSSSIFIINNVSIVLLSTILGIIFFRERVITKNWVGIGMAILSIILITYTQ